MRHAAPGQVALGRVKKEAEQAMDKEPATVFLHGLCFSFCLHGPDQSLPRVPSVTGLWPEVYEINKPSLPQGAFGQGVHHSNRKLTRALVNGMLLKHASIKPLHLL